VDWTAHLPTDLGLERDR